MQSIHGVISMVHKATNSTIMKNDVIMGWFIKSMNMVIGAQCDYVVMQLMVGNMIMMYEYSIKEDHNKFATKCTSSYIMDDIGI